jgi:hypothetical protein
MQPAAAVQQAQNYSGFSAAITWWGTGTDEDIKCNLKWQAEVGGETTKINQFQEIAGSLQYFCTYLFIKPGSNSATLPNQVHGNF